MKKVCSLLLALVLVFSLAIPAYANTLTVNGATSYKGEDNKTYYDIKFDVTPGSRYHQTDLFGDSFKNVMPGDTLTTQIKLTANFSLFKEDSIEVFLMGAPSNPLHYSEAFEEFDGKDQYPLADRDETVESNKDFLKQLNLTVKNAKTGVIYFQGTADQTFAVDKAIGTFRSEGSIVLDVILEVPITLNNDYANRVGEVDWTLKISAYDDPKIDNPKTGDYIMMAVAVMAVSAVALVTILVIKRRKAQK